MLTIHFTHRDLARSRIVADLGPTVESIFALHRFGDAADPVFRRWRRAIQTDYPGLARRCEAVAGRHPAVPDLMDVLSDTLGASGRVDELGSDGAEETRAVLGEFQRLAVGPHWAQVRRHLEEVRRSCGRTAVTGGIERLLGSLHPRLYWESPVMKVRDGTTREVHLDSRGIVLVPSYFLHDRSCVLLEPGLLTGGRTALVFPVTATRRSESGGEGQDRHVGDLIGHTRSAALHALEESCTTGELARRLGISLAGASQHAAVLRRAGLVTTARRRNTATHSLTPLGKALLTGPAVPEAPSDADGPAPRRVS